MAVIETNDTVIAGLADGQHYMELSATGVAASYVKVPLVLDMDIPENTRLTDDITPTDATNTYKVAVNFFETNDINFEIAFNPTNAQHMALRAAFKANTPVYCRILFTDARIKGYAFMGTLTKFTPNPDPKQKLRYMGTVVISGNINSEAVATV